MKKYLLSLFILFGLLFTSFSSALTINGTSSSFSPGTTITTVKGYCYRITNTSYNIKFYDNNDNYLGNIGSQTKMFCNPLDGYVKNEDTITTYLYTYNITNFDGNCSSQSCPECPTCPTCDPQYTSEQCQSVYGLVSSGDLSSCQSSLNSCQSSLSGWNNTLSYCSNSLTTCQSNLENCIQANCPSIDITTGSSTLYINDIWHQSSPFIYVNIPEEFNRTYSTGINDFTIDVEGYNVDTEYIDGIIRTQNYKPSSEDFTNLVGLLAPYTKYLIFLLFVFVLWAWIKNSFKSKKL